MVIGLKLDSNSILSCWFCLIIFVIPMVLLFCIDPRGQVLASVAEVCANDDGSDLAEIGLFCGVLVV